ncbi:hypothetical protein SAMN05443550_11599 [Pedobacter hartonius]|uniref:Uncharacterized protein n=1 Tax=Pedobacter hartonius TaxID=425514 RepID=A0A1H4HD82_9SPHI|nr:hypothetical protein SAMN05443550_11599 [Pedobacter hartonius]
MALEPQIPIFLQPVVKHEYLIFIQIQSPKFQSIITKSTKDS